MLVIAGINNYGSIKQNLLDVTEDIFERAHEKEIDLSAEYIKGSLNIRVGSGRTVQFLVKNS